ncbi:MAG: hypothetical protein ACRD12_04990, partial [Acidimicrobiales bacterium]
VADGVEAAGRVDRVWLAEVDRRRAAARSAVVAAGREQQMEAALRAALVAATERLTPADHGVDGRVASGAQLWLLAGAVVSALSGADPDPFEAWGRLVAAGWWPIGPCDGRLVVSAGVGS